MMLTQRISALAHDLARQVHVGTGGGGGGSGQPRQFEDKSSSSSSGKGARDTAHRYSLARRREFCALCCVFEQSSVHYILASVSHK